MEKVTRFSEFLNEAGYFSILNPKVEVKGNELKLTNELYNKHEKLKKEFFKDIKQQFKEYLKTIKKDIEQDILLCFEYWKTVDPDDDNDSEWSILQDMYDQCGQYSDIKNLYDEDENLGPIYSSVFNSIKLKIELDYLKKLDIAELIRIWDNLDDVYKAKMKKRVPNIDRENSVALWDTKLKD